MSQNLTITSIPARGNCAYITFKRNHTISGVDPGKGVTRQLGQRASPQGCLGKVFVNQ